MGAGPKNQLGIVSGLMAISRTLGQTAGVSIIGTLWAVRIHTVLGNRDLRDVTKAPLSIQIQGLQFIFIVVSDDFGWALYIHLWISIGEESVKNQYITLFCTLIGYSTQIM